MTKNSMAKLSERLQQQLKDDQKAVSNQTSALLTKHEQGLQKLSEDALNTTKSAIQSQNQAIEKLHSETLQHLRWLMMWPLLSSAFLSLVIVGATILWSWWQVNKAEILVQDKQQQIKTLEAEFCRSPAGQQFCKKKG